jgi:predicted permease
MWLPLSLQPQLGRNLNGTSGGDKPSLQAGDDNWWVYLVARLKPAITLGQAQAAADARFQSDVKDAAKNLLKAEDAPRLVLMPASQAISGLRERFSTPLTILMSAVSLVLLVASANVAGLMLARSTTRQRELALRLALGAGHARITRQLLTESLLLSAGGGAAGILLGEWGVQSLVAFMSRGGLWPSHLAARLDLRVLAFTAAASALTGLLFGVAPAFRGTHLDLAPALKASPAALATGRSRRWLSLGGSLVIAQVALSVLVLAGAGLLVRTLRNLKNIDPGFDTQNILIFGVDPTLNGYTEQRSRNLYSQLRERLEALPGVLSVTFSFDPVLDGDSWTSTFHIEGEAQHHEHMTDALAVGPKFFETMRIPLLAGRTFAPQDFTSLPDPKGGPIVINGAFARTFFKDENQLGRHILDSDGRGTSYEIIGIVGDARYQTLRSEIAPTAYVPQKTGPTTFEVRTAVKPETIIPAVRSMLSQLDANLPLSRLNTQSELIEASLFQERLVARLSSFFGGLSLVLACVGLYGLLSYDVTRTTREIGVRMALGAPSSNILRSVVGHGIALSAAGAILGILGALGTTRYLASLLYGVRPYDPVTFLTVAIFCSFWLPSWQLTFPHAAPPASIQWWPCATSSWPFLLHLLSRCPSRSKEWTPRRVILGSRILCLSPTPRFQPSSIARSFLPLIFLGTASGQVPAPGTFAPSAFPSPPNKSSETPPKIRYARP